MTPFRTEIEKALDELISNEEGMRFQGLAVVLAKQKWPGFIASERKKDLGLDAHAPAILARDGMGRGLACSLTATQEKIKGDLKKIRREADDVKVLLFATPSKVTKYTATKWADSIREAYGIELVIIPREDIITDLMLPANASICRTHLGMSVAIEPDMEELLLKVREAALDDVAAWLSHPRLIGRPKIALQAITLDEAGRETGEVVDLANLQSMLLEARRIVLEAPAGRGKTTTLIQLAERCNPHDLAFFIDLPQWIASNIDLLEFIASMPAFRSRGLRADDLAGLYRAVHCTFLLNGWNEISDSYSETAVRALAQLERTFPKAGIIVATRTHHIRPPLPGSSRTKLLPLTRKQRAEYLEQALGSHAEELKAILDADPVLDDLTRTPLILAEVTRLSVSGIPIPKTKVAVLAAVMRLMEQADEHRSYLERTPILGCARDFLGELAARMTAEGGVTIDERLARETVHSVSQRLRAIGQITNLSEPTVILSSLCSHHVLERVEYPSVSFRFEHQQFQEFYASLQLKHQLWQLLKNDDPDENKSFARKYINIPVWEEALHMVAENIGDLTHQPPGDTGALRAGQRLVELTLGVDPVFASDLSRFCGAVVWTEVRTVVNERLRAWYEAGDRTHRRCALAAMIATGSDIFIDILLPLLTADDQQIRLNTYRAWPKFYVTSLGEKWRPVVKGWKDEHRVEFIHEVVAKARMADVAEEFIAADSSSKIRAAVLHALWWMDANDALSRTVTAFDDATFEEVLRNGELHDIPSAVMPRALLTYERLLPKIDSPRERIGILLATAKQTAGNILERLKRELDRWPSQKLDNNAQWFLKSCLDRLSKSDPEWVSHWLARRIADGFLWASTWIPLVSNISEALKTELLERINTEGPEQIDVRGAVSVLAATADVNLAGEVFSRLYKLRADRSNQSGKKAEARFDVQQRLRDVLRDMQPNVAISGVLNRLSQKTDLTELDTVTDIFGIGRDEDVDLRGVTDDDQREALREYLKGSISIVLQDEDFSGHLKAYLAVTLARVGQPEDMDDVLRLVCADIDRLRRGREAWLKGKRDSMANGATTSWCHWYTDAIVSLDSQRGEQVLLKLLQEPEYEESAATALLRLARIPTLEKPPIFSRPDYRTLWEARSGYSESRFNEDRRRRYSIAMQQRISNVMEERSASDNLDSFNGRLKELAKKLAILDGRQSAALVLEIMALPGEWDDWVRLEALEAILFNGGIVKADAVDSVLNPVIDRTQKRLWQQGEVSFLQRCLRILPFVEPPSAGIARIKEVVAVTRVPNYELRELVIALGHSRCGDAVVFLLELPTITGSGLKGLAGDWIDALALLDTQESKQVLLGFVDQDIDHTNFEQSFDYHDRERLVSQIVNTARADRIVKERLYVLCSKQLSPKKRLLLGEVIRGLCTEEALVAGLELIDDAANPPIPYQLTYGMDENALLEHRSSGAGGYFTVVPRRANAVRARLFDMLLTDGTRRHSAWLLLGQIESLRLDYGRPTNESRHPAFDSGEPWPPIQFVPK